MKLIKPNVTEVKDFEGVDNFYKAVARAARICYASDKTTDDKKLVERLIKSGHFSPFEHAIIYVPFDIREYRSFPIQKMINSKYAIIKSNCPIYALNGRLIIENLLIDKYLPIQNLDNFLEFLKQFELDTHLLKSFIVDTSIGCTREINRHHDNFYICEQSTRYCNFSKDKFGGEISINEPYWFDNEEYFNKTFSYWDYSIQVAEKQYLDALKAGVPTDIARGILPLDTHTRAIYTATLEEWQHFIDLRLKGVTGKPHGDIMIIADKIDKLIHHK